MTANRIRRFEVLALALFVGPIALQGVLGCTGSGSGTGSEDTVEVTALTISSRSESRGPSGDQQNNKTASAGSLFTEVIDSAVVAMGTEGGLEAFARSGQNDQRVSAVAADGYFTDNPAMPYELSASSTLTTTVRATGTQPRALQAELRIKAAPQLFVDDDNPAPDDNGIEASFSISLALAGTEVFAAGAKLEDESLTESGTSLNPNCVQEGGPGGDADTRCTFAPLTTTVALGTFDPGTDVVIDLAITAKVESPGGETGGAARLGDPQNLGGDDVIELIIR